MMLTLGIKLVQEARRRDCRNAGAIQVSDVLQAERGLSLEDDHLVGVRAGPVGKDARVNFDRRC